MIFLIFVLRPETVQHVKILYAIAKNSQGEFIARVEGNCVDREVVILALKIVDKMDMNKLVDVLRATLQPDQREVAEKQLTEVK